MGAQKHDLMIDRSGKRIRVENLLTIIEKKIKIIISKSMSIIE